MSEIGHNNPPTTPHDEALDALDDLRTEAAHWLDGNQVTSQTEADNIGVLIKMALDAKKVVEWGRKKEKKPFDDGAKEVQARYKPLLEELDTVGKLCKQALTPWLQKIEAENRAKAEAARKEAEDKRLAAIEQSRAAKALDDKLDAERALKEAQAAEAQAKAAEKQKAHSKTHGRAIGLRTSYDVHLTDMALAARHYWTRDKDAFEEFLTKLAKRDVGQGKHNIPGFNVTEKREVA